MKQLSLTSASLLALLLAHQRSQKPIRQVFISVGLLIISNWKWPMMIRVNLGLALGSTAAIISTNGLASMAVVVDTDYGEFDFSGVGCSYGLGLNAAVSETLNIRLSYDVTSGDIDSNDYGFIDNIDTDIKQLALGLHYQF